MSRIIPIVTVLAVLPVLGGCDLPRAHGDANALIVAAEPALWSEVEDTFREAVEPTIQTVRDERPFRITHQDPNEARDWGNLRNFRQVIVLGDENDPRVEEALARVRNGEVGTPPTVFQVQDVWARGQLVSVLLLPSQDQAAAVERLSEELREILDEQFREYARTRMFVSGTNHELADSLAEEAGFSFRLPQVYRHTTTDSVHRFRNDNPSPRELIREVQVTWLSPMPEELPSREELEEWRPAFTREYYTDPQDLDTSIVSYHEIEVNGHAGVEFQSAWMSTPEGWPAGGPFITRAIRCPDQDRLYLMDGWVYAPQRDKYEYMIQLTTILDSFRCH